MEPLISTTFYRDVLKVIALTMQCNRPTASSIVYLKSWGATGRIDRIRQAKEEGDQEVGRSQSAYIHGGLLASMIVLHWKDAGHRMKTLWLSVEGSLRCEEPWSSTRDGEGLCG